MHYYIEKLLETNGTKAFQPILFNVQAELNPAKEIKQSLTKPSRV